MRPLVLALPHSAGVAAGISTELGGDLGVCTIRRFPDGESYVRLHEEVDGRHVVVVASLDHPDPRFISVVLLLETARELGARSVGLVAPYLCYTRQDRRFHAREAVSARVFPRLLGRSCDWLVTVDPHLNRVHELSEAYAIPNRVVHAAPALAAWIKARVRSPLLIGPDSESEPWVSDVARRAGAPFVLLERVRHGDREVEVSVPDVDRWRGCTPVLVDDIISTGRTMVATLGHLGRARLNPAICIGVHGLFAGGALAELQLAGAAQVVTSDAVAHDTNRISLSPLLASAARELLTQQPL